MVNIDHKKNNIICSRSIMEQSKLLAEEVNDTLSFKETFIAGSIGIMFGSAFTLLLFNSIFILVTSSMVCFLLGIFAADIIKKGYKEEYRSSLVIPLPSLEERNEVTFESFSKALEAKPAENVDFEVKTEKERVKEKEVTGSEFAIQNGIFANKPSYLEFFKEALKEDIIEVERQILISELVVHSMKDGKREFKSKSKTKANRAKCCIVFAQLFSDFYKDLFVEKDFKAECSAIYAKHPKSKFSLIEEFESIDKNSGNKKESLSDIEKLVALSVMGIIHDSNMPGSIKPSGKYVPLLSEKSDE